MCWFSAEHANEIAEATAGQRLRIKRMEWRANWVVAESELEKPRPTPVCLLDGTKVLFRSSEDEQEPLHFGAEAEAVFKMSRRPNRDVFEFTDGRQIALNDLPAHLILDVLAVPGSQQPSDFQDVELAVGLVSKGLVGEVEVVEVSPLTN